jgi:hypothetical protein
MRKEMHKTAACPFCGLPVERPRDLITHRPREMPVGACPCGAVYAYDATGHNLGAAFVEALVFACDMDWELAWGLLPEEDYRTALVENYDGESHYVVPGGTYEGRRVPGALFFVRLHQEVQEVTHEGVREKLARSVSAAPVPAAPVPAAHSETGPRLTKQQVAQLVAQGQLTPLLQAAWQDNKILRHLERLLCAGDPLLRYRTADFLGRVCAVVAQREPAAVANLLQGFATSFTYSAASQWGAIDAIGEIIRNAPSRFAGYLAALFHLLNDAALRPRVLRALGRIAEVRPDLIVRAAPRLVVCLQDSDPQTRGYAAWVLGILAVSDAKHGLAHLTVPFAAVDGQDGEIELYETGRVVRKAIGQVTAETQERINAIRAANETNA